MIVTLTGFMGAGKTTAGRLIAEQLGWDFIDLDAYIEHKIGSSIAQIIERDSLEIFRSIEEEAVKDIVTLYQIKGGNVVLALGGGTPTIKAIEHLIFEQTTCIYLSADEQTLRQRLFQDGSAQSNTSANGTRPLLDQNWPELLQSRLLTYKKAHLYVQTDGQTPDEVADCAVALLKRIM